MASKSRVLIAGFMFLASFCFSQQFEETGGAFTFKISGRSDEGSRKDYALLIANEQFTDHRFSALQNPSFDVNSLSEILSKSFGFKTEILINTSKADLIKKLRGYASLPYGKDDQLLIFFAGHGEFDSVFKQGYVVMKDARLEDETYSEYLSFAFLQDLLNKINCKHILLSLDVCYGGTFDNYFATKDNTFRGDDFRGLGYSESTSNAGLTAYMYEKLAPASRIYLSSGGNEVVPDGKAGEHSPFARAFLEKLHEAANSEYKILSVSELKVYLEKKTYKVKMGGFGDNQSNSDFLFIAR